VAGFCEHGIEPLGSVKCYEIPDLLINPQFLNKVS
jgi:hypothetical protein